MVSIPHYEDLSAKEIYDSLDLMWWASEKLDGSYLLFGLDDQGSFYSQRKGGKPCYSLDDWPDELWANTYRIGHTLSNMLVESLLDEGLIQAGQSIGAEILHGRLPNTVPYIFPDDSDGYLIVTNTSFDASPDFFSTLEKFNAFWLERSTYANERCVVDDFPFLHSWKIRVNRQIPRELAQARLMLHATKFKKVLNHWFPQESKIQGFSILEVLDINLASKHPNCGDRNWNELRKDLAVERDELREVFTSLVLLFKDIAYRVLVLEQPSSVGPGSFKEGVVVKTNNGIFKIVDRDAFAEANRFTHIVKYWIVGGRRPARPSFLSRTKDWPKEKRLARLEVLKDRYIASHYTMHYTLEVGGREMLLSYSGELHTRTLNMFHDTKKRIENGR